MYVFKLFDEDMERLRKLEVRDFQGFDVEKKGFLQMLMYVSNFIPHNIKKEMIILQMYR